MRTSLTNFFLFLLFSLTVQFASAQLSLRVVPLPNVSNMVASPECFETLTEIATAELFQTGLKTPSRTFCRVFFDADGMVTGVRVRSQNADAIVLEQINAIVNGISYCWTPQPETKETVFHLAFAIRIE